MHYEFGAGDYTPKDEDALELSEIFKREGQAKTMYANFRASTDDVASIAHNTGWTTEDIATVKNHLFLDSVLKDEGYGLLDPTYEIAVAWERLIAGNYYECDIKMNLNFEEYGSEKPNDNSMFIEENNEGYLDYSAYIETYKITIPDTETDKNLIDKFEQ